MISAILLDKNLSAIRIIKNVSDMFIAEKAYEHSTGSLTISVKEKSENYELNKTRVIFFFGGRITKSFVVTKNTMDATTRFPKVTFDLCGIEYLLNQRNEGTRQTIWTNITPPEICADLVGYIQNSDANRSLPPIASEAEFVIPSSDWNLEESWQLDGGNVWTYITNLMKSYEFCCDAEYYGFGISKLYFRVPEDRKDIIVSDILGRATLNYISIDYEEVATNILIGGEGEGIRRKYASYDSGETGVDRFEVYSDFTGTDMEGYISRAKYTEMMEAEAKTLYKEAKTEGDFSISGTIYDLVKTGDTIYVTSQAVNNGLLEPRKVGERKLEVVDGKTSTSITLL